MLIHEAFEQWESGCKPFLVEKYGESDRIAFSEGWNDYADALCKDGELTGLQYHYCPAVDDAMPQDADAERDYILDALGVRMTVKPITRRTDGTESPWDANAKHYRIHLSRGLSKRGGLTVEFSQGSAHTTAPDRSAVLSALVMDAQTVENVDSFEEWADDLGFDSDSRRAESIYKLTRQQSDALKSLFADVSFDDLAALFEDY